MSDYRDRFRIEGDCWCPDTMTLQQARLMGHTAACTQSRKGWEANRRHESQIAKQRREDEAAGRQLREAAIAALTHPKDASGSSVGEGERTE